MSRIPLTPDQQAEADRLQAALTTAGAADLRDLAELLAGKADGDLLGPTEFQVRYFPEYAGAAVEVLSEAPLRGLAALFR